MSAPNEPTGVHLAHSAPDDFATARAEEYLASATAGEAAEEDLRDEVTEEELGGPFVESAASNEFARGADRANPVDASQEPFPTVSRGQR